MFPSCHSRVIGLQLGSRRGTIIVEVASFFLQHPPSLVAIQKFSFEGPLESERWHRGGMGSSCGQRTSVGSQGLRPCQILCMYLLLRSDPNSASRTPTCPSAWIGASAPGSGTQAGEGNVLHAGGIFYCNLRPQVADGASDGTGILLPLNVKL